jgi:oligopeptide/dipeptide ABC transporter ATP-binding protein
VLQARWLGLMKELRAQMGMAILLITHDPAILTGWADRVLVMYAGTIVEEGRFEDVVRRPFHPYTRALLRSVPPPPGENASQRQRLPEMANGAGAQKPGQGCPFERRCEERQSMCSLRIPVEIIHGERRVRCFNYGE